MPRRCCWKKSSRYSGMLIITACAAWFVRAEAAAVRRVCIKEACVRAEVADTRPARERGLMFREKLSLDAGMLFVYERDGILSFWMRNTRIPLDLIWISRDKRVVHIVENAQPCGETCAGIVPPASARYVLEVNAGFAGRHGIKTGDRAFF